MQQAFASISSDQLVIEDPVIISLLFTFLYIYNYTTLRMLR